MFMPRSCGCKGVRTCLICEVHDGINPSPSSQVFDISTPNTYEYCYLCERAWEIGSLAHPNHTGRSIEFPGVLLIPNFITEEEEKQLVDGCDSMPWDLSQSGRRKQNFGPKTNFKKRRISCKSFNGFPEFSKFAQEKLRDEKLLADFQTIEQCAIEYRVETGACIDPHIDDCWVWGERVISINLLSDSVLSMTRFKGPTDKYNLQYAGHNKPSSIGASDIESPLVRILMPRLSLLVLYGSSRYDWEHSIFRSDIKNRRICMAYREFTPEFLEGGLSYDVNGRDVISKAQHFW